VERRIGGESRTLVTARALLDQHPGAHLTVVIGADLVEERQRWYGYPELAQLVEFLVVGRAGYPAEADGRLLVPIPDVSSREVRTRVATGRSIDGLVPARVLDYIVAEGLYGGAPA